MEEAIIDMLATYQVEAYARPDLPLPPPGSWKVSPHPLPFV